MKLVKETEDVRGKVLWLLSDEGKGIHMVEIKKGFARGGHFHTFESIHFVISGRILYRKDDMRGSESQEVLESNALVIIPPNVAHLFYALEDSIFLEIFRSPYSAEAYPKFRELVERTISDGPVVLSF